MQFRKTRYAFLFAALVASAQAQTNLDWGGGTADIANGTALPAATVATTLSGNWDTTTKNWSTDPTTTVYQAYTTATDVSLGLVGAGAGDPLSAAITLASGSNFTFSGRLYGGLWSTGSFFNQAFNLNTASGIATVTLGGSSAVLDFTNSSAGNTAVRGIAFGSNAAGTNSVRLAGSAQMIIRGGSRVSVNSDSSGYTGAVRVENGNLALGSSFGAANNANLNGATSFDIRNVDIGNGIMTQQSSLTNAMPLLTVSYGSNTFSNVIKDTANITLRGGQMTFRGIRDVAAPTNEIAGGLTLDSWGYLDLATLSGGTAGSGLDSQLTFASGLARTGTRDALLVGVNSTGTLAGNTSKVTLTGGSTTYGNNLLAWATTTRAEFLKINASDVLEVIASTAAATDLSTWASTYTNTSNIRVGNSTAFAPTNTIGNTTVNSLGLFPSGTTTLAQASGTTLTIQSGGISYQAGGAVTISGGTITTGTPASTPLYINAGSGAGAKLTITSVIAGANMDFVKSGLADVEFGPGAGVTDNTFTGTTYANGGLLTLNRQDSTAAANRISIPGNLVVNNGGRVGVSRGGQFAATSAMTVNEGGMLNLSGGGVTTTGTITINGGRILEANQNFTANGAGIGLVFNGGYITSSTSAPQANNLGTNVEYQSTASTAAVWEQLRGINSGAALNWDLSLGAAARTFTIANSATLAAGTPEMTVGARITSGTGGKIIKAGDGVLRLIGSAANDGTNYSGTNTYSGGTDVTNGSLIVGYNASNPAVTANAVVGANGMVVFEKPVNLIAGQKLNGSDTFVSSVISPTQVLMTGTTGLTTSSTRAALTFNATVARSGSLGTGAVSINGAAGGDAPALLAEANISIGNAITVGNIGSSRTIGGSSTSGTATYTSNILLNGAATLVAATGGTVAFNTGAWTTNNNTVNIGSSGNSGTISLGNTLVTTGGINVNFGTLSPTSANRFSSATPLTVSGGTLALGGSNQTAGTVTLISGAITGSGGTLTGTGSDFDVRSGSISGILGGTVGLAKSTSGTVTLSGVNSYSGASVVGGGVLAIGSTGTINNTSGISIGAGEFNYNNSTTALTQGISFSGSTGTLSGNGTITPAVTITTGNRQTAGTSVTTANSTASLGKETFTTGITYNQGSIFEWNLNADNGVGLGTRGIDYDAVNTGALATTGSKAIFRVILNDTNNFDETFWDSDRTWTNIFTDVNGTTAWNIGNIFNGTVEYYNSAGLVANGNATRSFTISGTDLTWSAVPEPTSAFAGLLIGAGLLRRRRA